MAYKVPDMPFKIGDIVQGAYVNGHKRYVVVEIRYPWIYARRIDENDGGQRVMFPLRYMLRKAA